MQAVDSRLLNFPDGVTRLVTLKQTVWDQMDWVIAQDILTEAKITLAVFELVQSTYARARRA